MVLIILFIFHLDNLRDRLNEIPKDKKIYVTCQVGLRGYVACRILEQNGIKCTNIDGGIKTYLYVKRAEESIENQYKNNKEIKDEVAVMKLEDLDITEINANITLNACGLQCPGPIKRVFEEINKMEDGNILEVKASDPGFSKDIKSWCDSTGNTLLKAEFDNKEKAFVAYIQKGTDSS